MPGAEPAGAAFALAGGRFGNPPGGEPGHARGGIEYTLAHQPRVHHDLDTFYRQAGLGNIGGQHHLAPPRRGRLDRLLLALQGKAAKQRRDDDPVQPRPLQGAAQLARDL